MNKTILVDNAHGQKNWEQTGFASRSLETTLAYLDNDLQKEGFSLIQHNTRFDDISLKSTKGIIIPSPTGVFNPKSSEWEWSQETLFSGREIDDILSFIRNGGRLFASSYRFGDPFTKTNLSSVFSVLGCILNSEATIDLDFFEKVHPLHTTFSTNKKCMSEEWACKGVMSVEWRPVTTFTLLSTYDIQPIVSVPRNCIRLQWPGRKTIFDSAPICVAGCYGKGRFVLAGGPHFFESTSLGLINSADNSKFTSNLFNWLFSDHSESTDLSLENKNSEDRCNDNSHLKCSVRRSIWNKVLRVGTNKEKEMSLLEFVEQFLTEIEFLTLDSKHIWSHDRESEIDLVFQCTSTKPLWNKCRGIVPVECKNWNASVGAPEISRFADKLDRTSSKIGIFVARSFTSQAWSTVSKTRTKNNVVIALINEEDLDAYIENKASNVNIIESSIIRSTLL
ncbi:MAG: restriction endonuclease [Anaerohalosphaera sp.]|nr:restriction endonuclease [Anaerohalosphaera sp.]